ncbi:MAG: arginine--tRNA ligase [Desulfobulbus sp.]|nr:MAG: arginine--tRNA ligase [Desulfobulbus sp.]
MIKSQVQQRLDSCFHQGIEKGYWSDAARGRYMLEVPKREGQGDFSTNLAMVVAGMEKRNPRDVAAELVELLHPGDDLLERVEIAGPGFVNFFLNRAVWTSALPEIFQQGDDFGRAQFGEGKKVLVEFVSANPTGPLSVGHGRNAILGDSIARLLTAVGYEVQREYYFNDAGRQMRVLGASTRARYLDLLGLEYEFPEDGYQGDYIYDIARTLIEESGDAHKDKDVLFFKEVAEKAIFADIDATLKRIGITFDSYFNEHTLYEDGLIDDVVDRLRAKNLVYEKDGATWFKTTEFGQEKDRVIIKNTGEPTYRLPDIAYHREKFRRGFDWMIDIFGADHIATVPDVMSGIQALGYEASRVTVILHQFVTLMRGGKQVKMSTRKATFVTVDELVDEVGVDALRFYFLLRKPDSQLEFDLDLATSQSQENPVYYVQYAHARLCSIARQAKEQQVSAGSVEEAELFLLQQEEEIALLKAMADYPAMVAGSARDLAPHRIIFFLMDLAGKFHRYYNKHKVLGDDPALTRARLHLCRAVRIVLRNGLHLAGMTAPEKM